MMERKKNKKDYLQLSGDPLLNDIHLNADGIIKRRMMPVGYIEYQSLTPEGRALWGICSQPALGGPGETYHGGQALNHFPGA